jgi:hypothetical protein
MPRGLKLKRKRLEPENAYLELKTAKILTDATKFCLYLKTQFSINGFRILENVEN